MSEKEKKNLFAEWLLPTDNVVDDDSAEMARIREKAQWIFGVEDYVGNDKEIIVLRRMYQEERKKLMKTTSLVSLFATSAVGLGRIIKRMR